MRFNVVILRHEYVSISGVTLDVPLLWLEYAIWKRVQIGKLDILNTHGLDERKSVEVIT